MTHNKGGISPPGKHHAFRTAIPAFIGLAALSIFAFAGCNRSASTVNATPASATNPALDPNAVPITAAEAAPAPGTAPANGSANNSASDSGPVRLARFVKVDGDVSWRPDDKSAWSQAVSNLPVRQGCEISTAQTGRAELQFDDGTRLQLGKGAVVTLNNLDSNSDGEYTEIALRDGTACVWPRNERSVYQVDTPYVAVDATGPGRCRIDADNGVQVRVQQGRCSVKGNQGDQQLVAGNYLDLNSDQAPYTVQSLPPHDDFDNWIAADYAQDMQYEQSTTRRYVPRNVALVSGNLDVYGDWRNDPKYGRIWHPRVHTADWRPYHDGHWVWVDPYGWTWVDDAPWGWAPSHYGTWVNVSNEWCWDPGPVNQYWSPAVVNYCQVNNNVAWVPLAPTEVRYPPALSVGFRGGDWSLFFSIGGAAVYYPTTAGYCEPRPWASRYVNNYTVVNNVTTINNYNGNSYVVNRSFVPYNARYAAGASLAAVNTFGGRGNYQALPRNSQWAFQGGRYVGAPTGRVAPVAGPPAVRPTAIARTFTRTVRAADPVPRTTLARPVYRAPIPVGTAATVRQAREQASGRVPSPRPGSFVRPAPGVVPGQRPNTPFPARPGAPGTMQRPAPAVQPRVTPGYRPGTPAPRPGVAVPNRTPAPAPRINTPVRPATPTRPTVPARPTTPTRPTTPAHVNPAQRPATPTRPATPPHATPAPRPSAPAHQPQQPVRRPQTPVRQPQPPVRHNTPAVQPHRPPERPNTPPAQMHRTPTPPARPSAPPRRTPTPPSAPQRRSSPPPSRPQAPSRPAQQHAPPAQGGKSNSEKDRKHP